MSALRVMPGENQPGAGAQIPVGELGSWCLGVCSAGSSYELSPAAGSQQLLPVGVAVGIAGAASAVRSL